MGIELNRRGYDAFLSHAHVDRVFVNQLYDWLTRVAGLQIWYDSKEMPAGTAIATGLNEGIEDCRGLIVVGSETALKSGWVRKEVNVAQDEQARNSDFRLVPIIIGESSPDSELRGVSWIKAPAPELTFHLAIDILRALHPSSNVPNPRNSRDLYISASWHAEDKTSVLGVCRRLASEGFRLIGDSRTQEGFSANRIKEIIGSCGAFVCIIPFRGGGDISADSDPYKYFVREINAANELGLPSCVFADPQLKGRNGYRSDWRDLDTNATELDAGNLSLIKSLNDRWQPPELPHYVFLATDLEVTLPTTTATCDD
jgi:hypothetical protein